MEPKARILIVEDDESVQKALEVLLREQGWEVLPVGTGEAALEVAAHDRFSLIVLDRILPDTDGLEVCRALREKSKLPPILMLTSKSDDVDIVIGLEIGADDYVTKPFKNAELVARIKALLRLASALPTTPTRKTAEDLFIGELRLDTANYEVHLGNLPIEVTVTEFEILRRLAESKGRTIPRDMLAEQILGYASEAARDSLNSHVSRLRKKLGEDPAAPRFIITVRGIGYRAGGNA